MKIKILSLKTISKRREKNSKKLKKTREIYTKTSSKLSSLDNVNLIDNIEKNIRVDRDTREIIFYLEKFQYLKEKSDMLVREQEYLDQIEYLKSQIETLKNDNAKVGKNPRRISDQDIKLIKKLRTEGETYSSIVKKTGWSKGTIGKVIKGEYDTHIKA